MADIFEIKFIDIIERERAAMDAIVADIASIEARRKNGHLSEVDEKELERLKALNQVKDTEYVDPLFASTRQELASATSGLKPVEVEHNYGPFLFDSLQTTEEKNRETVRVALILGLLQLDKAPLPRLVVVDNNNVKAVVVDEKHDNAAKFREALFPATGRASANIALARKVLEGMADAVSLEGSRLDAVGISTLEFAKVFTKLLEDGVKADDHNIKRRVDDQLDEVQEFGEDRPLHDFDIKLPDLEKPESFEVVADHCKLFGSFIFSSAFEELGAFQVVDRLIEMSQRGELPLLKGTAGTTLYNMWRDSANRMREDERQSFYAMTLGLPTGQPGVAVNTEFQDLWLRFVSSVSALVRESRVDQLLRSALPAAINQQQVKKAARDLAVNMSSRGYGMVFYAAADLQKQINEMIGLLDDKELRAAFGARDMWGVIEQVSQTEFGRKRNSSKYRMLATSGAIITKWIATNIDRLRDPTMPMVDLRSVENPPRRPSGQTAVSHPTDYDLVNACEMWLADSAMSEDRVEQMAQPRESPQQASRPIQIPSVARDLLEGAGLGLGMGMGANGNGRANGNGNGRRSRYQGY
jgi:hypothetical protein